MLRKVVVGLLITIAVLVGAVVGTAYLFPEKALALALQGERRASHLEEKTLSVDGLKWHVLTGGTAAAGELPLVLIHGFGGNADHWTRTARALTPRMPVIAPDLIGFGTSDAPVGADYSIPAQVARLHALLQQMGVTKAHFGGNSMGGWIAGAYAAAYPAEVASLWMLDAAGIEGTKSEMFLYAEQGHPLPLIVRTPAEFEARMGWVFVTPPPIPAPLKGVLMARDIARADHYAAIRAQLYGRSPMLNTLLSASPATEGIPTLVVWGVKDRVLHPDNATVLQSLLPNSKKILMPDIGHCPMLEAPAQAASDYLAWRDSRQL